MNDEGAVSALPPTGGRRSRDATPTAQLVELLGALVEGVEVPDFAFRVTEIAVDLLSVDDAGIMLDDGRSRLQLVASSSTEMAAIELDEIQLAEGPCFDAFVGAIEVVEGDLLTEGSGRWPRFAPIAVATGFASVYAVPLRYRGTSLGAMNLFSRHRAALGADELALGQALADATCLALTQDRLRASELLAGQLQSALDSRVVIEQAKGVVAEQLGIGVEDAFRLIRADARRRGRPLALMCSDVVNRSLTGRDLQG